MIRKKDFINLGAFDADAFPVAFNDVDLCMRARAKGLRIVWTPFAKLYHLESASRGGDVSPAKNARSRREQFNFIKRWTADGWSDPYYNPNLSHDFLAGPYGGIAINPLKVSSRFNRSSVKR